MKHLKIFLSLLITVSCVQFASSETITIQDCDDISLLNDAYANNKIGNEVYKIPDNPMIMLSMNKCWGVEQELSQGRIALKFDFTSIPKEADVTKATFSFHRIGDILGYSASGDLNICLINKDWNSSSANWDNLASSFESEIIATQDFASSTPDNTWFDFDVTDAVSKMVADPSTNFGFMGFIVCSVPGNSGGHKSQIHSAESPQEDLQPKVVVEYSATPIVTKHAKINNNSMSIHYNQSGNLQVSTKKDGNYSILFHTGNGRLISRIDNKNLKAGINTIYCGNLNLTKGLLVITLKNGGHSINSKAVIH